MPFNAYSRYYDLLYRDKDYCAEVDYIERLLQKYGLNGLNILEFGSGTGIHGRFLAQRGYRVLGIERSADMVAQAEQSAGFHCKQGDIRNVQLGRSFDAVLSLFHVISYQITNQDVSAVFSRASEHLSSGGLFIFDVWHSSAVLIEQPSIRIKRLEGDGLSLLRLAEPTVHLNQNRVDVHYTMIAKDLTTGIQHFFEEDHPMRFFSIPELDLYAEAAGFERLSAEEWLTGAEPSEASWGICIVLLKK